MINMTGNVNDKLRERKVENSVKINEKMNWEQYNKQLINLVFSVYKYGKVFAFGVFVQTSLSHSLSSYIQ